MKPGIYFFEYGGIEPVLSFPSIDALRQDPIASIRSRELFFVLSDEEFVLEGTSYLWYFSLVMTRDSIIGWVVTSYGNSKLSKIKQIESET